MKIDSSRLLPYAPFLMAVLIVALGWALLVRPLTAKNARAASDLEGLRSRIASARGNVGSAPPPQPPGDPVEVFERQVTARDASGLVMEELSRLASETGLQVDTIETADESTATFGSGPAVAGGAVPDPRLVLFQAPLAYTPLTLTGESDYRSLGEFLWRLRDVGALIEVRGLDVVAPAERNASASAGVLRVTLTVFVYTRPSRTTEEAAE